MSNSNILEIVQGRAQAASNAYDGAHDKRFSLDGQERRLGLRREEGCPIHDSRVIDGFKVKFYGDMMCISYQSDIKLKEVYELVLKKYKIKTVESTIRRCLQEFDLIKFVDYKGTYYII